MKLLLSNEQLYFFEKNGWLEVENLVRPSDPISGFLHAAQGEKKLLTRIAPLVAQLTCAKRVRFAFDVAFDGLMPIEAATLEELSPLKGVLLGVLISTTGSLVFLRPDVKLPEEQMLLFKRGSLIAFGGKTLQYRVNEKSSIGNELKAMGYAYGDTLKQSTHPILFG